MLGGEDPKERSNFGLKIEVFFIFFPKNLVWHVGKLRLHKDFGVADILF